MRIAIEVTKILRNRYMFLQLIVITFMLIAALISVNVTASMFVLLSYFVTFILNFIVLQHLFLSNFRRQFVSILCITIAAASFVGILDGVFRVYIPFYRNIFLSYDFERVQYAMLSPEYRALGTLGNPIIYGIEMILAIPFVAEVTNKYIRYTMIGMLLLASFYTLSTTVVILGVILLVGVFLISKRKLQLICLAFALPVILFLSAILLPETTEQLVNSPKIGRALRGNTSNIEVRQYLFSWALEHAWDGVNISSLLFGHGLKSSIQAVSNLRIGSIDSLENTYTTLLYEAGFLGLSSFVLMGLYLSLLLAWGARRSLHWYSFTGFLVVGLSFTTIYYSTFNFIWVASAATLYYVYHKRQGNSEVKVPGSTAYSVSDE